MYGFLILVIIPIKIYRSMNKLSRMELRKYRKFNFLPVCIMRRPVLSNNLKFHMVCLNAGRFQ